MAITVLNARELAAMSHEARRRNKELRELDAIPEQSPQQIAQPLQEQPLQARATGLDARLEKLKLKLDDAIAAGESQDALRYAQAIDRLEQSWARYAGVPTPPKGRASSRRSMSSPPEPLD